MRNLVKTQPVAGRNLIEPFQFAHAPLNPRMGQRETPAAFRQLLQRPAPGLILFFARRAVRRRWRSGADVNSAIVSRAGEPRVPPEARNGIRGRLVASPPGLTQTSVQTKRAARFVRPSSPAEFRIIMAVVGRRAGIRRYGRRRAVKARRTAGIVASRHVDLGAQKAACSAFRRKSRRLDGFASTSTRTGRGPRIRAGQQLADFRNLPLFRVAARS
jgi:hypothetical protein